MGSPGKPSRKVDNVELMEKLEKIEKAVCGNDYGLKIVYTNNQGFVTETLEQNPEDKETNVFVGEDAEKTFGKEDENAEGKAALIDLFWYMLEYFGLGGSKYSKARIYITTEPGENTEELGKEDTELALSSLLYFAAKKLDSTPEKIIEKIKNIMWEECENDPKKIANELENL